MADVRWVGGSGGGEGDGSDHGSEDRAQLLLVTGLALAVLLVALALLLNTAIYTENLATRNDAAALNDAHAVRESVERGLVGAMTHTNYADHGDRETVYEHSVANWSDAVTVHAATRGTAVEVEHVPGSTVAGTRLTQDVEGSFTSADGSGDWTLVADASGSRNVRFNVSTTDLHALSDDGDEAEDYAGDSSMFRVVFDEAGGVAPSDADPTWELYLYEDGGEVGATLLRDDGTARTMEARCTATPTDGHVLVDVENEHVGGTDCSALDALTELTESHEIRFERAGTDTTPNVRGTYELFVADAVEDVDDGTKYEDETSVVDASPYATDAVYSAAATLSYDAGDTRYETTVAVDPSGYDRRYGIGGSLPGGAVAGGGGGGGGGGDGGGGDGGNAAPQSTVDGFSVAADGGKKYDFTVDWSAEDTDGSLTQVRLVLYDPDGNKEEEHEITPATNPDGGSYVFQDVQVKEKGGNANAGDWRVEVIVTDDEGMASTDSDETEAPP
ncbi:hypothetical protein ACFO0N_02810 [Halobium salinum]|uniref:Flagellin n=1 Tax=Halobium salinum TaxID=1364940 RepID=A0ABD5P7L2_9EURY|nr:hypothetical protein [Halobium salinum]